MKNSKFLAILHFIVLAFVIWWNYYVNSGIIDGKTVASVSEKYSNLFTPAAYAFSIWGLIYLMLTCFGVFMLKAAFSKDADDSFILKAAPWVILAHIGNVLWLWFWINEATGTSVVIMIGIMLSLIAAILRLNMERWDAQLKTIAFVWWPIDLYAGWISVALIANVAAHLSGIGWNGGLKEPTWVIILIGVVTIIHLFMIQKRNMREFAAVAMWAFIAIAVKQWNNHNELSWVALGATFLLGLVAARHAYLNRDANPFFSRSNS